MITSIPRIVGIIRRKDKIQIILADAYQPKPNGIIYLNAVDLRACVRYTPRKRASGSGGGGHN